MKKLICILAAAMMIALSVSAAYAVDATYHDGKVTVSTGDSGFYEILIDGMGTGRWVGTGMPSNTFRWELKNGEHTVRLYSPDGDPGSSATFTVSDGTAAEHTDQSNGVAQEDQKDGKSDAVNVISAAEPTCTKNGVTAEGETIPALGHRYAVVNHNDTTNFYECMRCGSKLQAGIKDPVQNRYGNIILDENGAAAGYKAAPDKDTERTMTFTLDQAAEQFTLMLDNSLIMQIIRDGFTQVKIVNGEKETVIDLYQISPNWFSTSEKVDNYNFSVDSEGQVAVETLVNGETLAAEDFTGVTVK